MTATRTHIRRASGAVLALCASVCAAALAAAPAPALAATPAPAWSLSVEALPTNLPPGDTAAFPSPQYYIRAVNAGGASTSGPLTITDTLPAQVTPKSASGRDDQHNTVSCSISGQTVSCTDANVTPLANGQLVQVSINVNVAATASGTASDETTISGGGAPDASATTVTTFSSAPPAFEFLPGTAGLSTVANNADGSPATQAGSHPYELTVSAGFPSAVQGTQLGAPEHLRDLTIAVPPGIIVNPNATPVRCTESQLEARSGGGCPTDSQVGTIGITSTIGAPSTGGAALYNMVPPAGKPAEFGFNALGQGIYIHLTGGVQTGSTYALSATGNDISAKLVILGVQATFWGDPSDSSHDAQRGDCALSGNGCSTAAPDQTTAPLLTMAGDCSDSLTTTASADSWENPGEFQNVSAPLTDLSGNPVTLTGCDRLDFTPSITVTPDTTVADSPSGLSVDLKVPQSDSQNTLATANLKETVVTLPAGMSVNPSAANGLAACMPAQIGMNNANEPSCPDASKIGSVEIDSPLLPDPLIGGVYLAQQDNNPFGSLLAIYVTAEADGALIKLAGQIAANPVTGQLTTTFDNNPQLPFTDFKLDFFGGPGAALATPEQCGTYATNSSLSPWSATGPVVSSDPFTINSGCVSGFSPTLTAGTQNAQAGAYSPFVLSLSRSDTDQNFQGLSVTLPPGMLAKLAGVQECSEQQLASISTAAGTGTAQLANPSCPAGSQVGTVTTGAGVGPDPYFLSGKAYLTGPYKGGPYGLAIVVPAVAGPFDLGTVVVRQALDINPTTAQVTDVSDPFPTILDGIPLDIRRIDVDLNRPDFTVNPTSCDPMTVTGTATSTQGAAANLSSHFQVGGCQDIGFSPKLKIGLSGNGQTKSGDHPTLTATLTARSGQANLRSAKVTLPLSMALDPNNSNHVCNNAVAAAVHGGAVGCPASTIVGTATANTPLLSEPLTGKVYLVQGIRTNSKGQKIHTLPTLLIPLRGQIALDLRVKSSVSGAGALVTTFSTIPDAQISKFTLKITGGKKGLLVITGRGQTICGKPQVASENLGAQSGKSMVADDTLATPCKATKKSSKKARR